MQLLMTLHEHVTPGARASAAGAWGEEKVTCARAQGSQARLTVKLCPAATLFSGTASTHCSPGLNRALHADTP
jgi:hypothetical protein